MALCLTRKEGEKIFIGDDIVIVVTDCEKGKVRVHIEAPRSVVIEREELVPPDDPRRANLPRY